MVFMMKTIDVSTYTQKEQRFFEKINERFGANWFDFTGMKYESGRSPITVTCLKHDHVFTTTPSNFLGCHINPCLKCVAANRKMLSKKWNRVIFPDPLNVVAHKAFRPLERRVYGGVSSTY